MTDKEAIKLAIATLDEVRNEAFRLVRNGQRFYAEEKVWNTVTALKEQLAQPEQEPVAEIVSDVNGHLSTRWYDEWTPDDGDKLYIHPPQRTEQNFCPRCGKRTKDLTHIHTCTPPKEST